MGWSPKFELNIQLDFELKDTLGRDAPVKPNGNECLSFRLCGIYLRIIAKDVLNSTPTSE